jgi:hypothetical protein
MYFDFRYIYKCEEKLKSSIIVCVHTLFCELLLLFELEHFLHLQVFKVFSSNTLTVYQIQNLIINLYFQL